MKYYFRPNKDSKRIKELIGMGYKIPEVLIFAHAFKIKGNVYYPINYEKIYFCKEDVIRMSKEETEEYLKKEKEKSISDYLIEKVRTTERIDSGVASFAWRDAEGDISFFVDAVCHASFRPINAQECITWDTYRLEDEQKESVRELYHWMMNHSPWLHCILPSWDILSAQERTDRVINGPIPLNLDAPANEAVGFAIALRTISEHHWTIPTFLQLRKEGASIPISFILSGFITYLDNRWERYENSNWHHFMSDGQKVEDLCHFFKNGYSRKDRKKDTLREVRYNYIASQIAKEGTNEGIGKFLNDFFTVKGSGWGRVNELDNPQAIIKAVNEVYENV